MARFQNGNGDKMSGFLPLRPGVWWMRRWHLPGKLITVGVDGGCPGDGRHGCPVVGCGAGCCRWFFMPCALYMGLASDLHSVAHAMEQTTRGDWSARAGVNGRDEVGSMAQSLDRMVLTLNAGGGHSQQRGTGGPCGAEPGARQPLPGWNAPNNKPPI